VPCWNAKPSITVEGQEGLAWWDQWLGVSGDDAKLLVVATTGASNRC